MANARRPSEVAEQLGISTSTLRRWSDRFSDFLSLEAGNPAAGGQGAHRRYTETDVETLAALGTLLEEGLTYDEAYARYAAQQEQEDAGESDEAAVTAASGDPREGPLVAILEEGEETPNVARFVFETLNSLSSSQKLLLSEQQTGRQLLGVVLQDNFNLKEENARLRERMLEAERTLFELKRELDDGRSQERERMRHMESQLFELQRRLDRVAESRVDRRPPAAAPASPPPPPAPAPPVPHSPEAEDETIVAEEAPSKRRSFWAWLFGE